MIQSVYTLSTQYQISSLSGSKDILAIGTLDEDIILLSNLQQLDKIKNIKLENNLMGVIDLDIDSQQTQLAASLFDSTVRLYNLSDLSFRTIQCEPMENFKVQFVDNFSLISGGGVGKLSFYNITLAEKLSTIETEGQQFMTCFSQLHEERDLLITGHELGQVFVFDLKTQKQLHKMQPHLRYITSVLGYEHKSISAAEDLQVKITDLNRLTTISNLVGHKAHVVEMAIHPGNKNILATASYDGSAILWDLRQNSIIQKISPSNDKVEPLAALVFASSYLVIATENGVVHFYK